MLFVLAGAVNLELTAEQRQYIQEAMTAGHLKVEHLKNARQIVIKWDRDYYLAKTNGCKRLISAFRNAAYSSQLLYGYAELGLWVQAKRWGQQA